MALLSFVQGVSANAATATIASTQVGDLIVVFAFNNASTTVPTVPGGYTSKTSNTTTTTAGVVASKRSTGSETSIGTWTNATGVVVLVFRAAGGLGTAASTVGNSTALSYPTIALARADGTSWVAGGAIAKGATAGMNGTTAALTSNRTNQTTVNGLDTNGGVSSFAAQTLNVTTSGRWITFSVEILSLTQLKSFHFDADLKKRVSSSFHFDARTKRIFNFTFDSYLIYWQPGAILLQDSGSGIWKFGLDFHGVLISAASSGSPTTVYLNDSAGASWQITVSTTGDISTTSVTARSAPTYLAFGPWLLFVKTNGDLFSKRAFAFDAVLKKTVTPFRPIRRSTALFLPLAIAQVPGNTTGPPARREEVGLYARIVGFTFDAKLAPSGPTLQSGSFHFDADLKKTVGGSFHFDADLKKRVSGSFTFNADLKKTVPGSFTFNADLRKVGVPGSFTFNADLRKAGVPGSFHFDAQLNILRTGSFHFDADLKKTVVSSFHFDADLKKRVTQSFTFDADLRKAGIPGSFHFDARLQLLQIGSFHFDADLKKTVGGSFTFNADLKKVGVPGSFHFDADLKKTGVPGSFKFDADLKKRVSTSFTFDSDLRKAAIPGSFHFDARLQALRIGSFTFDADLKKRVSASFTFDSTLVKVGTKVGGFHFDADLRKPGVPGSFTFNADLLKLVGGSFTFNADLKKRVASGFTFDADLKKRIGGTFSFDSALKKTVAGSFHFDAQLQILRSSSFHLDAVLKKRIASGFTFDGDLKKRIAGIFTFDASLKKRVSGSFHFDATLRRRVQAAFTFDATLKKTVAQSFTFDAKLNVVGRTFSSFTFDAILMRPGTRLRMPIHGSIFRNPVTSGFPQTDSSVWLWMQQQELAYPNEPTVAGGSADPMRWSGWRYGTGTGGFPI